jgi:hypothetical protein
MMQITAPKVNTRLITEMAFGDTPLRPSHAASFFAHGFSRDLR